MEKEADICRKNVYFSLFPGMLVWYYSKTDF